MLLSHASLLALLACLFAAPCSASAAPKTRVTPKAESATPVSQLEPELEPHAGRYNTEIEILRAARLAELAQRRTAYLAELDGALAKIATGADAALIGSLRKERSGVADGLVVPANPTGFPPEIQAARKFFFNRIEAAALVFNGGKKKLDDAYLKLLTTLARQTRNDKPLVARIAAEKRRVLTGQ